MNKDSHTYEPGFGSVTGARLHRRDARRSFRTRRPPMPPGLSITRLTAMMLLAGVIAWAARVC